jgi:hypothetical protein
MNTSTPSNFFNRTKLVRGIVDVIRQNANGAILYIFVYNLYRLCSDYTTLLLDSDQFPDEVKMTWRAIELVFPGVATTLSNCESFLIYLLNYLSPYYVATNIVQGCFALKARIEKISTLDGYTEWFKALLSRRHPQRTFQKAMGGYLRIVQAMSSFMYQPRCD